MYSCLLATVSKKTEETNQFSVTVAEKWVTDVMFIFLYMFFCSEIKKNTRCWCLVWFTETLQYFHIVSTEQSLFTRWHLDFAHWLPWNPLNDHWLNCSLWVSSVKLSGLYGNTNTNQFSLYRNCNSKTCKMVQDSKFQKCQSVIQAHVKFKFKHLKRRQNYCMCQSVLILYIVSYYRQKGHMSDKQSQTQRVDPQTHSLLPHLLCYPTRECRLEVQELNNYTCAPTTFN